MRFNHFDITAFRNLTQASVELGAGLNYFHGDNGAGKTAFLEAVHLLCRGRSFRTQRVQGLIQHEAEALSVRATGVDEFRGPISLAIQRNRKHRTELRVDGQAERRMSVVARLTPLQVMLPDISELVFGGPALRRQWLDWGTFHVKPDYLTVLRDYLKVLKQRNSLLRENAARSVIAPWTEQMLELSATVSHEREQYLLALAPHFISGLARLDPEIAVTMRYNRGWPDDAALEKLLGENHAREVKYGATQWGPHRADVVLQNKGAAAASVLSRGQAKLVASALQISQAAMLAEVHQRSTVFLIDDAGAELDWTHNQQLFRLLGDIGGQILATTTQRPDASDSIARVFDSKATSERSAQENASGASGASEGKSKGSGPGPETVQTERFEAMDVKVFHVEHGAVTGE